MSDVLESVSFTEFSDEIKRMAYKDPRAYQFAFLALALERQVTLPDVSWVALLQDVRDHMKEQARLENPPAPDNPRLGL